MVRAPGDDAGTPTTVTTVTTDDTISLTEATCKAGTIAHALSDTGCSAGEYCVNLSGSTGVCAVDYLSGFTCDDTLCGRIGAADADCYTVTVGVSTTAVCLFEAPL